MEYTVILTRQPGTPWRATVRSLSNSLAMVWRISGRPHVGPAV